MEIVLSTMCVSGRTGEVISVELAHLARSAMMCSFGRQERTLSQREHDAWAARLQPPAAQLRGPVYFLWGTDWEDAPVVNAARLQAVLPPALQYDWKAHARAAGGARRGSLLSMLAAPRSAGASSASVQGGAAAAGGGPAATPQARHKTGQVARGAEDAHGAQEQGGAADSSRVTHRDAACLEAEPAQLTCASLGSAEHATHAVGTSAAQAQHGQPASELPQEARQLQGGELAGSGPIAPNTGQACATADLPATMGVQQAPKVQAAKKRKLAQAGLAQFFSKR
jgi:hypothetical protein